MALGHSNVLAAKLASKITRVHACRRRSVAYCPLWVCAVKGGAFQWVKGPPGDSLQPEATGAVMEVTKWLKPSV
jgi:hypothetical protein